ncbi:MAG: hypothetical protein DRJ52_05915 [Thermoprotei archaeon]|nr:MAG: hypothetical protein DRJ52_05915 [Thermoprotei archaeon]RLE99453.1 MAG: hypothetical protein DRJ63_05330 [Thermoprotei archaeon]
MGSKVFTLAVIVLGAVLVLTLGGIVISLLLPAQISGGKNTSKASKHIPEEIWSMEIYDLKGNKADLSKYKGKVIIIDFFATYCAWCKVQIKELIKLKSKMSDIYIVSISVSAADTPKKIKVFVENTGIDWPIYIDKKGNLVKLFNIRAIPTTVIIGPTGKYIKLVGLVKYDQLIEYIKSIKE